MRILQRMTSLIKKFSIGSLDIKKTFDLKRSKFISIRTKLIAAFLLLVIPIGILGGVSIALPRNALLKR